mmetsp:Transcript_35589/g.111058  ORF Transcript_35589/g.111058 Transcript_35589/m.111058 type:complete len:82 (+) Transcript_35589:141-386(+)
MCHTAVHDLSPSDTSSKTKRRLSGEFARVSSMYFPTASTSEDADMTQLLPDTTRNTTMVASGAGALARTKGCYSVALKAKP